jgi:hypothetical protein
VLTSSSAEYQSYYEFDAKRLSLPTNTLPNDGDGFPSYLAPFAKDTYYLYMDHRSYTELAPAAPNPPPPGSGAYAEINPTVTTITADMVTRPYLTDAGLPSFVNPTSFQILCAGQDGEWGGIDPASGTFAGYKGFPGGMNYTAADRDNITNFSEGRTLEDHIP